MNAPAHAEQRPQRCRNVCAVVVTFRYAYTDLVELIAALHAEVGRVVIVDNNDQPDTPSIAALGQRFERCTVIENHRNAGLAAGFNQGIGDALEAGFPWVILFDQDSRPAPGMLDRLASWRDRHCTAEARIAAIGPAIHDARAGQPLPFVRFGWRGALKLPPDPRDERGVDADMLISSGCMIDAHALRTLGAMDERLFIDNIDMEWCFRARAAGYRVVGVGAARLDHRLGDQLRRLPLVRRAVLIHSPIRQYYIMRNRIWLYRRGYVPGAWKLWDLPHLLFKLGYFPLFVAPRLEHLRMMLRGLRDGLLGGKR